MAIPATWNDPDQSDAADRLAAPLAAMVIASLSATLWLGLFKLAALV